MKHEIDTETLIGIGEEYMYAEFTFRKERLKAGYRHCDIVWLEGHRWRNDALWQAYANMERKRELLYMAAELLNTDAALIVNAARCYDRYYARGGTQLLDSGRLLEGMH